MMQDSSNGIVIERVFDAPRDLVWQAWTDPAHAAKWWGPGSLKTRVDELDLRVGGAWRYVMTGSDGAEYPQHGVFSEIAPPERIVTSAAFEYGPGMTQMAVMTYAFEDLGAQTKLIMTHTSLEAFDEQMIAGVTAGWNANWDSFVDYVPTLVG